MLPLILLAAAIFLVGVVDFVVNTRAIPHPKAARAAMAGGELPLISILVPAYNAEEEIVGCLRSLLAVNYPNFEVVALDDRSTDSTYAVLCRLRDQDYRLRILIGPEPPDGWEDHAHACWQLANAARGQYLLFTETNCRFTSDALLLALGAIEESGADVVALMPENAAGRETSPLSWWLPFLPPLLFRRMAPLRYEAGGGAFLFLDRDTYFRIDDYRAAQENHGVPLPFLQEAERAGRSVWLGDGDHVYHRWGDIRDRPA